uniref:Oxidoreductase-like domain-containing protein n=1 Tax=Haemonchus placei TaxID=6290 RepID=A0A0N4WN92_HAEPC
LMITLSLCVVWTCGSRVLICENRSYPPVEPMEGACCGQGCSNCVWVVYAQELIDYYREEIEMKVPDQNVRAFVLSELRSKWNRS